MKESDENEISIWIDFHIMWMGDIVIFLSVVNVALISIFVWKGHLNFSRDYFHAPYITDTHKKNRKNVQGAGLLPE